MPFTVNSANLPDHVKKLPDKKKAQWVEVWNSAFAKCTDGGGSDCEATAFRQANGAVVESIADDIFALSVERDTGALGLELGMVDELMERHSETVDYEGDTISKLVEVFAALTEQAIVKTESGHKFPPEAFAHVPDPEKPSTWKCRVWQSPDRGVTRDQLNSVIKEANTTILKARLRAEYRALKVYERNIPKAVQETEPMERLIGRELTALQEAAFDSDKGEVDVTIIEKGFNKSGKRFYPWTMLQRDKGIFEGLKMFADHPTKREDRDLPERSVRSWVGNIVNVSEGENGTIRGRAKIIEPWFKEKLALLKDQGLLQEMGVSIVALGEGVKTKVEGKPTQLIERLVKGRSVDFVTFAGAGGMVECFESEDHPEDSFDIGLVDADRLAEARPDLIEIFEAQTRAKLVEENGVMEEKDKEIAELKESNEALETEKKELQEKVDVQDATVAKAEVTKLITEAELPDATKARLTDQFKEASSTDGVVEAIEAAVKEVAALKEVGVIKDMGDSIPTPEETKTAIDALRESRYEAYLAQGKDEATADRMATAFVKG